MNDHLARLESSGSLLRPTAAVSAGETAQQQRPFWDSFSSSVPPKFAQQKPVQFSDEQIMYDYKCFPCSKVSACNTFAGHGWATLQMPLFCIITSALTLVAAAAAAVAVVLVSPAEPLTRLVSVPLHTPQRQSQTPLPQGVQLLLCRVPNHEGGPLHACIR